MTYQTAEQLFCIVFEETFAAEEAVVHLQMSGDRAAELASGAIVGIRGAESDVRLAHTTEIQSEPVMWHGLWLTLLVGLIYAASIAGTMWGISLAGLWSRLTELGLSRESTQALAEVLQRPGSAAFFPGRLGDEDVITATLVGKSFDLHRLTIPESVVEEVTTRLTKVDPRRLIS